MKIKFILLLSFATFFFVQVSGQEKKGFTITGFIKGLKDGEKVSLLYRTETLPFYFSGTELITSTLVKNGQFKFKGFISDGPRMMTLWFPTHKADDILQPFPDFLMDNERIVIRGEINKNLLFTQSVVIEGSRSYDEQKRLVPLFDSWRYSSVDRFKEYLQAISDSIGYNKNMMDGIVMTKNYFLNKTRQEILSSSSNQAAAPYFIQQYFEALGHDSIVPVLYNKLDKNIKKSYYGKLTQNRLYLCVGKTAPDFSAVSQSGKPITLNEIEKKGKLTIIDFWAAGCIPCRKEYRDYTIDLYHTYHPKGLEIIGVSWDTDSLQWKKAIADDRQPWINICSFQGQAKDTIYRTYQILHTPQNVIVDKTGKILAWNISGLELHNFLDHYFNN